MNKIYKVIYCKATQAWVAVSELAKGRSKGGARGNRLNKTAMFSGRVKILSAAVMLALSGQVYAGGCPGLNGSTVECGSGSNASGSRAVAIGLDSKATGSRSLAVGEGTEAAETQSVAIGSKNTKALGDQSIAIGGDTVASGADSIAIGGDDLDKVANDNPPAWNATGLTNAGFNTSAVATKYHDQTGQWLVDVTGGPSTRYIKTEAKGAGSVVLGVQSKAVGDLATAIGTGSKAEAFGSTAFGIGAKATKENSIALGAGSITDSNAAWVPQATIDTLDENGNTVGTLTYTKFAGGSANLATGDQVSVGSKGFERQIKNVAPGEISATSTDAINGSQLAAVAGKLQYQTQTYFHVNENNASQGAGDAATNFGAIRDKAGATGAFAVTAGVNAQAINERAVAIGVDSTAGGKFSVAVGDTANASGLQSVAIGLESVSSANNTVALGRQAEATAENATALGNEAKATIKDTVAVGQSADATADSAVAVGKNAQGAGTYSVSIGLDSSATGNGAVTMGSGSGATADYTVALGNDAKAQQDGAVALGHNATATVGYGVALGEGSVADVGGGVVGADPLGAAVSTANSIWTATTAAVSVGDGTTITRQITSVAAGTNDTDAVNVAQLKAAGFKLTTSASAGEVSGTSEEKVQNGETVTVDAGKNIKVTQNGQEISIATKDEVEFTKTTVGNVVTDAATNKITGLEAGDLNATSTDAVNGSQLFTTNTNVSNNATEIAKGINFGGTAGSNQYALGDTINVKGDSNITSTTVAGGVQLGLADSVVIGTANPITINGTAGTIGGLTNTTFDPNNFTSGQAATEDQLSLISATANAGFTIAGASPTTAADAQIKPNDIFTIVGDTTNTDFTESDAGKNIYTVVDADNTVRIGLANDLDVTSVKAQTVNATTSLTIGDATDPANSTILTSGADGLDVGGDKITGVADGTIGAGSTDAVNGSQLFDTNNQVAGNTTALGGGAAYDPATDTYTQPTYKTVDAAGNPITGINDANNVGDALKNLNTYVNKGFNVQERGITKGTVTPTESIDFVDGTLTTAKVTTEANGVTKITFDVDAQGIAESAQLPVVYTKADGTKVYKQPDGTFNEAPDGSGATVPVGDIIASMQNPDGTTSNPTTLANVAAGIKDTDAVNVSQLKGMADIIGGGAAVNSDGTIAQPTFTLTDGNPSTGGTANYNTVGDALTGLNNAVNQPITFKADTNSDTGANGSQQKLGSEFSILSGDLSNTDFVGTNLATEVKDNQVLIGMSKTPEFESITLKDGANETKLTTTADGLDVGGDRITNVATGINDMDAVNVKQLNDTVSTAVNKPITFAGDTGTEFDRKLGEKTNVKGGATGTLTNNNIGVEADGTDTLTIKLAENINLGANGSLTTGDTKIDNNGLTINGGPSVTKSGIDAGDKKITNVAAGTLSDSSKDAVNGSQLFSVGDSTAAALGGTSAFDQNTGKVTAGLSVGGNNYTTVQDALTGLNATASAHNTTTAGTNIEVVETNNGNGGINYEIKTKDEVTFTKTTVGTVVTDSATNKITGLAAGTNDKDAVNFKQLKDGSQAIANALGGNTTVNPDGTISQPTFTLTDGNPSTGSTTNYTNVGDALTGLNTAVNQPLTFTGDEGTSTQKLGSTFEIVAGNATDTSTDNLKTKVENGKVTISMANAPTFTGKVSAKGFDAGGEKITNVAPGDVSASSTDAVNGSQLYAIGGAIINNNTAITNNSIAISNNSANIGYNTYNISKNAGKINDNRKQINTNRAAIGKGINIGSDSGEMVNRQLGDVIAFSGDRNITTKTTKKGLQVTLNPDLTADSLRAGNTLVNHDGVRISGGNNGDIMLTNNGLDNGGNRVKSIAAGINDTDAVNVSQLKEAYRHIDGVKDDASAGIAAAIAMANMPQPHDPGASMMSLGVGAHRDQQAIAIGLSTISDNGKWILKGSLSQDTQSNVSAGVGVGYQW